MISHHIPHHDVTDEDQRQYNKIFKEFLFNIPHNMNPFAPQMEDKKSEFIVEYHWRSTLHPIPTTANTLYICFNHPIPPNTIPNNIIILCFLCENKTGISKGPDFNQNIDPGVIPNSVRYIYFINGQYNKPLMAGALPNSVEYLFLSDGFNQPFKVGDLPSNLCILETGDEFNQPFDAAALPPTLKSLFLGKGYNQPMDFAHLINITCLVYDEGSISEHPIISLPPKLEFLLLPDSFNHYIPVGLLPKTLRTLTFGDTFNSPIVPKSLPNSLESINLGKSYNLPFDPNALPKSLKSISFHQYSEFNHPLENIPNYVHSIELGQQFNQPITQLPSHLRYMKFGQKFNQNLEGVLPSNLTHLYLGVHYKKLLTPGTLPESLKVLVMNGYTKKIPAGVIPPNCKFTKNPKATNCSVM
ncbi:hypothetical protein DICPUDRAFT_33630 [Dictyostelium purpureum]|uniref:Uncharacterized protein n=1 Tax=Dictyostelium purpureum TaxID=5786 RepID=F0ZL81_DICPU|nr:uncharacterized protein DICPUDRAFT_33630 [Dictyostelium purpureum]EGC35302.1 hypothetical protein DICPUDRAFT_33630 [Dictyostelium purpureum]|eukprot:XP_003288169.1 hypothetical protein DICPUDRAFT_33630 [Dictyostelium purpureum]